MLTDKLELGQPHKRRVHLGTTAWPPPLAQPPAHPTFCFPRVVPWRRQKRLIFRFQLPLIRLFSDCAWFELIEHLAQCQANYPSFASLAQTAFLAPMRWRRLGIQQTKQQLSRSVTACVHGHCPLADNAWNVLHVLFALTFDVQRVVHA
jgi:hypothetical protein